MSERDIDQITVDREAAFAARATYIQASETERERTLVYLRGAVNRLAYLQITKAKFDGEVREMICIRTKPKRTKLDPETVRADIENVWRLEVARTSQAMHKFANTSIGFEFRFALMLENGEFVTGVWAVDLDSEGGSYAA